ncbi:MAG: alpha/beta hydrolase [Nevskia sp.]|nr:alpha/beta hydrolase [Nevskia sp.]
MKSLLRALVRLLFKPTMSPRVPLSLQRRGTALAAVLSRPPHGTTVTSTELGGVPALELRTGAIDEHAAVLYLHGGAYVLGGPVTHTGLAARIGRAAAAPVYLIDYRLAPEHPFPAALEDALAAYRKLLEKVPANRIGITGDSAGGGLTLATAMAIRDAGLPQPAALAVISPWTDLTLSGDSMRKLAKADPMLREDWLRDCAARYAGTTPLEDPRISPLYGNLKDLPPILVHVGSDEVLLSDAERLAERAQATGADLRLHRYDGLWHVFHLHGGQLKEADAAIEELGSFLRQHRQAEVSNTADRLTA